MISLRPSLFDRRTFPPGAGIVAADCDPELAVPWRQPRWGGDATEFSKRNEGIGMWDRGRPVPICQGRLSPILTVVPEPQITVVSLDV
jgi:hypothetical protein